MATQLQPLTTLALVLVFSMPLKQHDVAMIFIRELRHRKGDFIPHLVELASVNVPPKPVVVEGSFQAEELSEVAFPLGPCFVELPQPLDVGLQAAGAS